MSPICGPSKRITCQLTPGHRGPHSSVVFTCDLCDRTFRGNGRSFTDGPTVCFLCERFIPIKRQCPQHREQANGPAHRKAMHLQRAS